VLESWRLSAADANPNPPATEVEIAAAEHELARALPESLRSFYAEANGGSFLDGNLSIEPLRVDQRFAGLVGLTNDVRQQQGNVPPELVLFGGDGSDQYVGLWLRSKTPSSDAPVIQRPLGDTPLAIAGTSLCAFLTGRTAYYLLLIEAPVAALDAIAVPDELRHVEPDDELFAHIRTWADPGLADSRPDPYRRPLSANELRTRFGAL
jgi:hypothetical protein